MSRLIRLAGVLALAFACLPAGSAAALSYPVTSTADTGAKGTLRGSIEEAGIHPGPDLIPIEVTGTIGLTSPLPTVAEVTISGPGAASLTIERIVPTPFRIFRVPGDATFSDLTVSGGKAEEGAGFFSEEPATLTLIRVAVTGNEAFDEGTTSLTQAIGGGILSVGPLTLRESFVAGNAAVARGAGETTSAAGGGVEARGTTTIVRSTISGNAVESFAEGEENSYADGGGLMLLGGAIEIEESTISGNSARAAEGSSVNAATGGGFYALRADLTGSTVSGNSVEAEDNGGERTARGANVYVYESATLGNTILADPQGNVDSCDGSLLVQFLSAGFNLDEDGSCGLGKLSDLSGVAPGLQPLADNGGPTPTHALAADSPAVDRGTSFGLTTDQRGLPRPSDFPSISNAEGGDGSDIGAFELQVPAPAAGGSPVLVSETPADTTPPNTRIVSGPARKTFKRLAKFRFASTEAQSHFQCKLDKKRWKACANPFKRTVRPGKHLFRVRAIDRFGNVDPTPARFGWRVKPITG